MTYPVELCVRLRPVWHRDPPVVNISINENSSQVILEHEKDFEFCFDGRDRNFLEIEFLNKQDSDTVPELGLDKAVSIESVSFFGILDPKFVWLGKYSPRYPEPWAGQQRAAGVALPTQLTNVTWMGWNGVWRLEFSAPVFTWIHQMQNLGWIHE